MRNFLILYLAVVGLSSDANSQQSMWSSWRISDLQFSIGNEVGNTSPIIYPGEISKFAPGSMLIGNAQSDYFGDRSIPSWSSSLLILQVGFHPYEKVSGKLKKSRTLRLGLMAQGIGTAIYSSHTDLRYRIDTLLNNSNSSLFGYIDSVHHENSYADYSGTAIKLDGSFVWSTDPERRFSLNGGMGFNAGILLETRTEVYVDEWSREEILDDRGYQIATLQDATEDYRIKQEQFRNKSGWSASFYTPLGVDLRLGKEKAFWNQLHLFTEMRPSLTLLGIPETKTYAIPGIQNTAGFKVHW